MQDPVPDIALPLQPVRPLHFVIGQNEAGQWLALEAGGRMGGLFKSRADAVHFARFESGEPCEAIEVAPCALRLVF